MAKHGIGFQTAKRVFESHRHRHAMLHQSRSGKALLRRLATGIRAGHDALQDRFEMAFHHVHDESLYYWGVDVMIRLEASMNTISLKVPQTLATRLEQVARQQGISKSAVIRDALEGYLQAETVENRASALSREAELAGALSGPEDLSVNPGYLQNFGR